MTQAELEQLSRDVAEKYGIEPFELGYTYNTYTGNMDLDGSKTNWLHDDIGRCATLAIEHSIDLNFYELFVNSSAFTDSGYSEANETYAEHNGNKIRATCVAILKALLAKDKP